MREIISHQRIEPDHLLVVVACAVLWSPGPLDHRRAAADLQVGRGFLFILAPFPGL
jgi:hypothetical protein